MMGRPSISFFAMNFILLFIVVSFILMIFDLHRFAFVFELGMGLVLIFFLAFSMFAAYNSQKWGWTIIGAALILLIINTLLISFAAKTFDTENITIIFFSVIGALIALFNLRGTAEEDDGSEIEDYEKTKDYYPYIDKMEPAHEKKEPSMEKTFTPGKFIASKKANKFHSPKCDWAKRISSQNQLWFNSREEAEAKGLEADQCVG